MTTACTTRPDCITRPCNDGYSLSKALARDALHHQVLRTVWLRAAQKLACPSPLPPTRTHVPACLQAVRQLVKHAMETAMSLGDVPILVSERGGSSEL